MRLGVITRMFTYRPRYVGGAQPSAKRGKEAEDNSESEPGSEQEEAYLLTDTGPRSMLTQRAAIRAMSAAKASQKKPLKLSPPRHRHRKSSCATRGERVKRLPNHKKPEAPPGKKIVFLQQVAVESSLFQHDFVR